MRLQCLPLILAASALADPATPFGRNLLRNAGAEMTSEASNIPGWQDLEVVKVDDAAKDIDSGRVKANISGYVGALRGIAVATQIVASFQDGTGKNLGQLTTTEVSATDLPQSNLGGGRSSSPNSPVLSHPERARFYSSGRPNPARHTRMEAATDRKTHPHPWRSAITSR